MLFRLLLLLLGSAVCFMSTVADDLYGGFNQSAALTVTTGDLSLTDRPTDRPIDEAVPFNSVESGLRSTGSALAETSLSLSSLTTAVRAFFTLCLQPGQTVPPLTTENFYLLQDWQQEIKAMPADLSEFPACSEQIIAFASVLNESSGECSFTQRQEMQTAYQSVAECAGVTTIIEPLGNVEMALYREKMVLTIWHSSLVRWQQSPESAELMADLQQKSLELLNMLSGSENVQYRQLTEEISELYALLSLSLEEPEPYLSQAKQQANSLAALVTAQASGTQFRFYQPDAGNESPATEERCGCSWKRSNFRVLPQPPAAQPLAAYEPWQITYNYTLTGNPAECPLPDYVQVSLRLGHKQNRFVGKHTEKYVSGASGKAVILFKEGPYGPGIYNVQLTLREANDKESAQFDLGSHEWKYLGTIIKSIEARQGDNFKLNYPPNFSTGPAWLPVDPLSKLDLKLSLIKGINPMNETLVIYYAPPNFNPVSDKFIELLREPLRERLIISFALMPAELQNLPKGRGSIMAFLESASSGEFPTLRNVGLRNSHPKSLSMVTEIFETMFIKGWEECEKKLPEVLIVTDSVSGVSRFPEVVTCDFSVVNADGKAEIYPLNEIRVLEECSKFLHPEMEEKWENLLDEIGLRRHYGPPESFSPGVVKVQDSPWNEIVEKSGNYSRIGLRVFHPRNPNNIDDRYFYSIKKKNDSFRVVFSSYAHFYPNYHPKNPEYVPKDKFFLELKTPLPGRIYFTWGNYRFRLWGKPLSDESGAQKHEDTIMLMKNQWLKDKQTGLPLWLLKSLEHYVSLANGGSAPVRRTFAPFSFNVGGKQLGNGKEKIQIEAGFMPKAGGAFYDTKGLIQFGVNSHLSRTNGSSVMSGGFRPEFAENVEFKIRHNAYNTFLHEVRHAYQTYLWRQYDINEDNDGLISGKKLMKEGAENFGRKDCVTSNGRVDPTVCDGSGWNWSEVVGDGFLIDPNLEIKEENLLPGNKFHFEVSNVYGGSNGALTDVESAIEMDAYLFANFFDSNRISVQPSPPKPSVSLHLPTFQSSNIWYVVGETNLPEGGRIQMTVEGEDCSTSGFLCNAGKGRMFIVRFKKKYNSCKKVSGQNVGSVITQTEKKGRLRFVDSEGRIGPLSDFTVKFNGIDVPPSGEWLCDNAHIVKP